MSVIFLALDQDLNISHLQAELTNAKAEAADAKAEATAAKAEAAAALERLRIYEETSTASTDPLTSKGVGIVRA